eukprot:15364599-Ditylum_brightwellii.AAC.3
MGVGVVGTSRFRKGWPPKNLCAIIQQQANWWKGGKSKKKAKDYSLEQKDVKDVWGNAEKKEINILRLIDDYNH